MQPDDVNKCFILSPDERQDIWDGQNVTWPFAHANLLLESVQYALIRNEKRAAVISASAEAVILSAQRSRLTDMLKVVAPYVQVSEGDLLDVELLANGTEL